METIFRIVLENTREPVENPVDIVLKQGKTVGFANHTILISRDGSEIVIADSAAPILDKNGKIIGVVLVFRDITEKKKMEEELLKMNKLESVGVLAGGIAHDFNNILAAILGNVSLARMYMKSDAEKAYEKMNDSERAILRAKDLTQQLLTFSKGGVPIKKTASIVPILKEATLFVLTGSSVKCDFDIQNNLFPVDIDEGLIGQVINNLVINAEQAMPGGGILVVRACNVSVERDTIKSGLSLKKGRYVKIEIQDRGVGIQREHIDKIFDPYFTTKQKGSGLGLTTAYSIIQKHDGYIIVDSTLGTGTVFSIYLPVSGGHVDVQSENVEQTFYGNGKILLMDDNEIILETTGEILNTLGYIVEFARNGREAVAKYEKAMEKGNPFDLVILDLTIPGGMGGKEAIEVFLSIDPNVKAIVSSGYSNDPVMGDFKKYGFSGIVTKPYQIKELSETIHMVLDKAQL